jgi:ketosteroid isomerase-like protein
MRAADGAGNRAPFDEREIRQVERELEAALSVADPSAWLPHCTEDAVFVAQGGAAAQGREASVGMSTALRPLSSVKIEALKSEGSGPLAAVCGRASWVSGAGSPSERTSNVRLIIVWRKRSDGR